MKFKYTNAEHSQISGELAPGEVLGNMGNPATATGPLVFSIGMSPGNREHDDLMKRVAEGKAKIELWAPPPVDLRAYAKQARDTAELGGITVQGVPIATDDRSKTLVLGARSRAAADPDLVTSWAATDGNVYPLSAAAVIAISDAIGAFVADLFEAYAEAMAGIQGGTIKTPAQVDALIGAVEVAR